MDPCAGIRGIRVLIDDRHEPLVNSLDVVDGGISDFCGVGRERENEYEDSVGSANELATVQC